jgi:hypothetical protein
VITLLGYERCGLALINVVIVEVIRQDLKSEEQEVKSTRDRAFLF